MDIFKKIRAERPIVHSITNKVTINDCANVVLAIGASAVMAEDAMEVEEITAKSRALCINIGTLSAASVEAMVKAGKKANELNIPVLLDPVGMGASELRKNTVKRLMKEVKLSVIRGNFSEIMAFYGAGGGVIDADEKDSITAENIGRYAELAEEISRKTGCVIAMTGETDIVTDGNVTYCIHNGNPMMRYVTGAGCMTSALTASFMSAESDNVLKAAFYGVCSMGIAGEIAMERMTPECGNASYRNYIIDAIYNLTQAKFERRAKYEIR